MTSVAPLWINAVWGFAEGTLFFVVPDLAFTFTTLDAPKRGLQQLGAAILGAVAAGALMYMWADARPTQARAAVAAVPFVGEAMVAPAEQRWDANGTRSLFANPLNGVPYKVYAVLAPEHLSLGAFLLLSLPLRAERMLLSWIIFAGASRWFRRLDATRARRAARIFYAGFWTLVYVVYWIANWR